MLRRKITDRLLSWKNNSNKALLVTGARQIGKSYAIRAFGKSNYASYFEVNLLLDVEARNALVGAKNSVDFINRVALLADAPLVEHCRIGSGRFRRARHPRIQAGRHRGRL